MPVIGKKSHQLIICKTNSGIRLWPEKVLKISTNMSKKEVKKETFPILYLPKKKKKY